MDASLTPFTDAAEHGAADDAPRDIATGSRCRCGCSDDINPVLHRFEFVTLAFDKPQTVFRLPQWRWPLIGPYNGFSGSARIRGWQLIRFYEVNGWLAYSDVCSVTGIAGSTQLHNEDYGRPWDACPVSKRAHTLIHARARFLNAWADFVANEALPETWAKALAPDGGIGRTNRDCAADQLLEQAPHPAWVVVRKNEFDHR